MRKTYTWLICLIILLAIESPSYAGFFFSKKNEPAFYTFYPSFYPAPRTSNNKSISCFAAVSAHSLHAMLSTDTHFTSNLYSLHINVNVDPGTRYFSSTGLSSHKMSSLIFKDFPFTDSLKIRTSGLKQHVVYRPFILIFNTTTVNINKRFSLIKPPGSTSYEDLNPVESQYKSIFGNFTVNSPAHDFLTLSYILERDYRVTAKIFNVLGAEVTTLFADELQAAGQQRKVCNIADRVSSGIYILRLTAGTARLAKRIQIL